MLVKPVTPSVLFDTVMRVLGRGSAQMPELLPLHPQGSISKLFVAHVYYWWRTTNSTRKLQPG